MRIGFGFDAHRFETGRKLVLGGVAIPYEKGLLAHSDGDVVIHALCDALLGAAGLGDIGGHFPDTSDDYAGIDSRILLRSVVNKISEQNIAVANADICVIAQSPRLAPYIADMKTLLASDIGVDAAQLNVKATTTEGMGFTGRGEGIACYAVALLEQT
jgi:2-C-methyl-D-erythritol 2,4-cyclodiphosphate synthase